MTTPAMEKARVVRDKLCIDYACLNERGCGCLDAIASAISAAVAEEREACANLCTSFLMGDPFKHVPLRTPDAHECAAAIRSRISGE